MSKVRTQTSRGGLSDVPGEDADCLREAAGCPRRLGLGGRRVNDGWGLFGAGARAGLQGWDVGIKVIAP